MLTRNDGNWVELVTEVRDWLDKFIPPHMLISVSLFEDAHENVGKGINACIAHSAGSNLTELAGNEVTNVGCIYDLSVIAGSGEWEDMFGEAKAKINEKGGQEGHLVAATNDSSNDGGVVIVLSWSTGKEETLKEVMRPAEGGCGCTIF